ncbi:hypothetical protein [Pedobacter sp. NJ-S-72]
MKSIVFLILLLFTTKSYSAEPEIQKVKTLFETSAHNKVDANRLLKLLSVVSYTSPPLLICYKGAAEMMQAKHGINPIHKFARFKKGKKFIEEAVKKEPHNLEIRFLRFMIQTNLPAFLKYNDNINEDKKYLLANLETTKDQKLKQDILTYLSNSKLH